MPIDSIGAVSQLSPTPPPTGEYPQIRSAEQYKASDEQGLFLEYLYTKRRTLNDERIADVPLANIPAAHKTALLNFAAEQLGSTSVKVWQVQLPSIENKGEPETVGYVVARKGKPNSFTEVGLFRDAARPNGFLQYAAPQQYSGTKR